MFGQGDPSGGGFRTVGCDVLFDDGRSEDVRSRVPPIPRSPFSIPHQSESERQSR
jgi:hypothetical protein